MSFDFFSNALFELHRDYDASRDKRIGSKMHVTGNNST